MKVYRLAPHNDEKQQLVLKDFDFDVIPEEKKPIDDPREEIDWDDSEERAQKIAQDITNFCDKFTLKGKPIPTAKLDEKDFDELPERCKQFVGKIAKELGITKLSTLELVATIQISRKLGIHYD